MGEWQTVVGLEIHVELATRSKLFCGCSTAFGAPPNTHCCEVCTGQPGSLPVVNGAAIAAAVRTALALGCTVQERSRFDRKNYFYPDLPKAYQISQLYAPLAVGGGVALPSGTFIRIHELHVEEDAGKLLHTAQGTLVDYNRCGVPLIEIVTEPDFSNAGEVEAFVGLLRQTLQYLGVSDGKMQEGSLRVDVNLSLRRPGGALGTRTEIKNLGSISAIGRAMAAESARQQALLESGQSVEQQTRRFDERTNRTTALRSKEDAQDYRYFPDPDLPPLQLDSGVIAQLQATLPELPAARKARFERHLGLSSYDSGVLTQTRAVADFFEATAQACGDAKQAANWVMGEVLRLCKESETALEKSPLTPQALGALICMVQAGRVGRNPGKQALETLFQQGGDAKDVVDRLGLWQGLDEDALQAAIHAVLARCEAQVAQYRAGKTRVMGFLMGQVIRETEGKAPPEEVRKNLERILQEECG